MCVRGVCVRVQMGKQERGKRERVTVGNVCQSETVCGRRPGRTGEKG